MTAALLAAVQHATAAPAAVDLTFTGVPDVWLATGVLVIVGALLAGLIRALVSAVRGDDGEDDQSH